MTETLAYMSGLTKLQSWIQYKLKWNLLSYVTTDGDKNMCKEEKILVS